MSSRLLLKNLRQRRDGSCCPASVVRSNRFVSVSSPSLHSSLAVSSNEDVAKSFVRSLRSKQSPLRLTDQTPAVIPWLAHTTATTAPLPADPIAPSPPTFPVFQEKPSITTTATVTSITAESISPTRNPRRSRYQNAVPEFRPLPPSTDKRTEGGDNCELARDGTKPPTCVQQPLAQHPRHGGYQKYWFRAHSKTKKSAKATPQLVNLEFLNKRLLQEPTPDGVQNEIRPAVHADRDPKVPPNLAAPLSTSENCTTDNSLVDKETNEFLEANVSSVPAIDTAESPEGPRGSVHQLPPPIVSLDGNKTTRKPTTILVDAVTSLAASPVINGGVQPENLPQTDAAEELDSSSIPQKRKSLRQMKEVSGSIARLYYNMHQPKGLRRSMEIYREMVEHNFPFQSQTIRSLFRLANPRSPFDMYELLQYFRTIENTNEYMQGDGDINAYVHLYERVCYSVRYFDSTNSGKESAEDFVRSLVADIRSMDRRGQGKCFPTLVSSLVQQRWVRLGSHAKEYYERVVDEEFPVSDGWFNHLLSLSLFNRQMDLDFADVALRSVKSNVKPRGSELINALENFYPYNDVEGVEVFLESILKLRKNSQHPATYNVDMNTLEQIGCAAARYGDADVNLLIWDVVDSQKSSPTVGIYENTTTAFACNPFTFREAFVVLIEMEANGFVPSRALIRTLSTRMRTTVRDFTFAIEQLRQLGLEGKCITQAALNVLISCAGERGDVGRLMDLYSQFDHYKVDPNADTFSFVFEALGKRVRRNHRTDRTMSPQHCESYIVTADSFIERMEDMGVHPTHHIIRDYVEFLCHMNQVDTANEVVFGVMEEPTLIGSKTLYRLSMANSKRQQFDTAREIAQLSSATSPMRELMLRNIVRDERDHCSKSQGESSQSENGSEPTTLAT